MSLLSNLKKYSTYCNPNLNKIYIRLHLRSSRQFRRVCLGSVLQIFSYVSVGYNAILLTRISKLY